MYFRDNFDVYYVLITSGCLSIYSRESVLIRICRRLFAWSSPKAIPKSVNLNNSRHRQQWPHIQRWQCIHWQGVRHDLYIKNPQTTNSSKSLTLKERLMFSIYFSKKSVELGAALFNAHDGWAHHPLSFTEMPNAFNSHVIHPALHAQLPVSWYWITKNFIQVFNRL